ncbi:MAG: HEAT repeat domain-containing protein [Candidatus Omnitrophica bacterium]|nr:HEAT repeat domain-containing protein [Candidatus Omnitrophota bacterium]
MKRHHGIFSSVLIGLIIFGGVLSSCAPKLPDEVTKKSVKELMVDLESSDGTIKAQAATALGMKGLDAKEAIPALIELFKDKKPYIQNTAMKSLAQIGNPAVPALIEAYETGDKTVQFYAANTLKKIGTDKAMAVYQKHVASGGK